MSFIANASVTKALLNDHGFFVKKRFGQNFIIDPSVVIKIAENCGTDKDTTVIEIGPGLGALSEQLALRSKEVVAYEIDTDLIDILKVTLKEYPVRVINGDFLKADLSEFENTEKVVICANVPYNITTPILFKLIESSVPYAQMTLMVQKELAQRLNAKVNTKQYNALSIIMDYLFERKILSHVSKRCFYPMPQVDSMVIQLFPKKRKEVENREVFFTFLRQTFGQRRKTLYNNLRTFIKVDEVEKVLTALQLDGTRRPENLTLEEYIELYKGFYEN